LALRFWQWNTNSFLWDISRDQQSSSIYACSTLLPTSTISHRVGGERDYLQKGEARNEDKVVGATSSIVIAGGSRGLCYIHWQFLCSCNLLDTLDLQTAQFDVILNHRERVLQECFGVTKRPRDLGEEKIFHTSDSRI
jgi:hypothetical protein